MRTKWMSVLVIALVGAGCDPEAPVQSSDVEAEIDAKIAVHAGDATTHTNLLIPAANISGEIDGAQIEPDTIGLSQLGTGSVASDEIADQSIASADIGTSAVGPLQLADNAVTGPKIAADAVDASKLAPNAVTGGMAGAIMDQSISAFDMGPNSVAALQVIDGSIGTAEITNDTIDDTDVGNNALTAASLATNSVAADELANDAVDSAAIANNAVIDTKIADLAVTQTKLNTNMAGRGTNGAATTVFSWVNQAGNVTFTITGACRSDAAGSVVILRNDDDNTDVTGDCGDALANPPETFKVSVTAMDGDLIQFRYDSEAMGDITEWQIYSVSF